MFKECTGKSVAEIKLISNKAVALEVLLNPKCLKGFLAGSPCLSELTVD